MSINFLIIRSGISDKKGWVYVVMTKSENNKVRNRFCFFISNFGV